LIEQGDKCLKIVRVAFIAMLSLAATIGTAQSDQNNDATASTKRPSDDVKLKFKPDQSKQTQGLLITEALASVKIQEDPFSLVEQVTLELIAVIQSHRKTNPTNEKSFFSAIRKVLMPHVDFSYMAKMVMGSYRKIATNQQRDEFTRVFRDGLIETYGRGLLSFNNEKIVLADQSPLKKGQNKVYVKQEIHGLDRIYPLSYTMRKKKTGKWMITNVTINGINLGKTLRNQFLQSAQKNSNDLDFVISSWANEAI
jgi:phospholipid transport system substrate-binding protein